MILLDIPEPKNCDTCIFCDSETGYCCLSSTDGTFFTAKNATKYIPRQTKPDWCPASKKFEEIYVITSGEYSDYEINAVTISKEKAEKLKKYYSRSYHNGDAEIETYKIDEPYENLDDLIPVYHVRIDRSGKCFCIRETWMHEKTKELIEDTPTYIKLGLGGELVTNPSPYGGNGYLTFHWYGAAKDEEHAMKIAQDKRAEMLEKYFFDLKTQIIEGKG